MSNVTPLGFQRLPQLLQCISAVSVPTFIMRMSEAVATTVVSSIDVMPSIASTGRQ
jgi:hypothetical protein